MQQYVDYAAPPPHRVAPGITLGAHRSAAANSALEGSNPSGFDVSDGILPVGPPSRVPIKAVTARSDRQFGAVPGGGWLFTGPERPPHRRRSCFLDGGLDPGTMAIPGALHRPFRRRSQPGRTHRGSAGPGARLDESRWPVDTDKGSCWRAALQPSRRRRPQASLQPDLPPATNRRSRGHQRTPARERACQWPWAFYQKKTDALPAFLHRHNSIDYTPR